MPAAFRRVLNMQKFSKERKAEKVNLWLKSASAQLQQAKNSESAKPKPLVEGIRPEETLDAFNKYA